MHEQSSVGCHSVGAHPAIAGLDHRPILGSSGQPVDVLNARCEL